MSVWPAPRLMRDLSTHHSAAHLGIAAAGQPRQLALPYPCAHRQDSTTGQLYAGRTVAARAVLLDLPDLCVERAALDVRAEGALEEAAWSAYAEAERALGGDGSLAAPPSPPP